MNPRQLKLWVHFHVAIQKEAYCSRDPDALSKTESGKPFVTTVVPNKTIWHSDRNGDYRVRNGEGFVSWGSFYVPDEIKGQEIAAALKHAIEVCR